MRNIKNLQPTLTSCDKEVIHLAGKIQAHGFLLIFDKESLKLEQGSNNTYQFLGTDIEEILGKPLQLIIGEEKSSMEEFGNPQGAPFPRLLKINDKQFISFIHQSSGKIIVECEPYTLSAEKETIESGHWLGTVQAQLNQLNTLESLSKLVAGSIQHILDIDRVLVFKFDQDWHAEALAEKVKPGIRSYEGHHFPASDIPAPARALLEKKHIRHIPDVNRQPVALSPYLNPKTGKPTDVLQAELRYPAEVHLEYLRNMNVLASISFSIIVKGKLWGLVSCTNEASKVTSFQKRQLCMHVVKAFANILLSSKEKRDHLQFQQYKLLNKKLIGQVALKQDIFQGLGGDELNLLSITESAGAAILLDKKLLTFGQCPEEYQILEIANWLKEHHTDTIFHTRELSSILDNAHEYCNKASGLLALEISRFNKEYIFFFKPEIHEKRIWAGNPEKPMAEEDLRVHPRKSFERWEEIIRGKSQAWTVNELEIAQVFLKDIVALRLKSQNKSLEHLNEAYQSTADGLQRKNKQLEDFARIITHNLRSPLANIQALYSLHKSNPELAGADFFSAQVKQASENMLATIEDLNTILKTGTSDQLPSEPINLSRLIEKELQNLEGTILRTGAEVKLQLLAPEVYSHKVYMESILHNLISNALKYSSPERKPEVTIKSWFREETFLLSVSDNGVGIDLEKYGHKIFSIYQTFHQHPNARGVGLYLTKMQVESLGGMIRVESFPTQGTTFTISLNPGRPD